MKSHSRVAVLTLVTVGQFAASAARAQAADSLTKVKSDGSVGAALATPADTVVKKKGGMFGKLKGAAHNKTVQNIAKAAVCQAVPGGQYMMGAAEAAKAKTSLASGAANAQSCIPGMPGAAGGMGGMGGGKGALAGAAMGAAGSIGGGAAGQAAASARGMPGMPGMPSMPAGATMTATAQSLAGMQGALAQMNAASLATGGTGEMSTEASGEQIKLSGAVPEEIRKGKLVIKKIDWVHDNAAVSPPATQGFMDLMMSAGQAMKSSGGTYRVDVYMDKKYADAEIATLGAQRAMVIVSLLQAGGQLGEAVIAGKVGKDKEQRVELVKVK